MPKNIPVIKIGNEDYYVKDAEARDRIDELKSVFENYTDNIIGYPDLSGNIEIVENYYIPDSGTITAMDGFYYTSLIPVDSGKEYELYIMAGTTANPVRIHGYDSAGNWFVLILNQGIGNPDELRVLPFTVPANVTQIRISTKIGKTIQTILPNGFRTVVDQLETKIDSLNTEPVDFTNYDAGYIAYDGTINYSGNWKHTHPISLRKDDVISVTLYGLFGVPVILKAASAYVPLVTPVKSKNDTFTYTLTEDANIIINFTSTYDRSGTIQKHVNISNIEQEIQKVNDLCKIPYMSMLHKMGVLGDSLSSGEIWNGSTVRDCYNYSWLSNIARDINADCVHYSRGGMTAKEWWEDGGGYKTSLANETEKPTAYYIAFGTNDKNQSEYPLGNITDIAGSNSFVGYMRSIIEYVHAQQQNAVVFLVSTYNISSASEPYNEMIEEIADLYSYCFFVNYADNGQAQLTQENAYMENSHFTTIGYVYVANVIKELTEAIIKNNLAWFKHFGLDNYAV